MTAEETVLVAVNAMGDKARAAARTLATATTEQKNKVLLSAADKVVARQSDILAVNTNECGKAKARQVSAAFVDRMTLTSARISDIAAGLRNIAALEDPVGKRISSWSRPNGLEIERVRTPIGVIAIIYESRPNVTVDAGALCLKAGNAAILRGGSECVRTSKALFDCLAEALTESDLPAEAVQFVETTDRNAVGALLTGLDGKIDLVIPRGGKSLVARVQADARAPVLSHLEGICHIFIDRDADPEKAVDITVNSKMRRTGVCGAAETLLIDQSVLNDRLPNVAIALRAAGCEIRGDKTVRKIDPSIAVASEEDWRTEYLAPIISVAAVDGVDGAIAHLEKYSSHHTDVIVTENEAAARQFFSGVDSAIVLHNASTQFADGGEFGLGGEIGIATGRLHARGPVGVEELTTYKNIVHGTGQVRPD